MANADMNIHIRCGVCSPPASIEKTEIVRVAHNSEIIAQRPDADAPRGAPRAESQSGRGARPRRSFLRRAPARADAPDVRQSRVWPQSAVRVPGGDTNSARGNVAAASTLPRVQVVV